MSQYDSQDFVERQAKQKYLKENIIDAGYDASRFSIFICAIRPDGENIDLWTIDELKKIVGDFIHTEKDYLEQSNNLGSSSLFKKEDFARNQTESTIKHNHIMEESKESKRKISHEVQDSTLKSNIKSNPFEPNGGASENIIVQTQQMPKTVIDPLPHSPASIKIEKKSPTDPIQGTIEITKMEHTPISLEDNVAITVEDPEVKTEGLFAVAYVSYAVKTAPFGWCVKRRFNDFLWLRETLVKLHPGVFVPPIPKKRWNPKLSENKIRKRMYYFETFLNTCMQHRDLKSDKYLFGFLSMASPQEFAAIREQGRTLQKVVRIEKLASSSGQIKLDMSPENNKNATLAENYCRRTEPIYKKIRNLTKVLVNNMRQSANIVLEMSKWVYELEQISNNFNSKLTEEKLQPIVDDNVQLSVTRMMEDWSRQLREQASNINKNFVCFYKYSSLENDVFKEMNKYRAQFETECQNAVRELELKKERLFNTRDVTRWELNEDEARTVPRTQLLEDRALAFNVMLEHETKQVRYQNNMLAYLNANTQSEMLRGLRTRVLLYKRTFQTFVMKQSESLNRLQQKWAELMNPANIANQAGGEPENRTYRSHTRI